MTLPRGIGREPAPQIGLSEIRSRAVSLAQAGVVVGSTGSLIGFPSSLGW